MVLPLPALHHGGASLPVLDTYLRAPPNQMIKNMITALDENFAKLSLTPSFQVPKYRKDAFLFHALDTTNIVMPSMTIFNV